MAGEGVKIPDAYSRGQKRGKQGSKVMAKTDYSDKTYRIAIIIGQVTGIIFLIAGCVLMILGVTGTINFVVSGGKLEAKLINAAPGVVIALFGAVIIIFYKPKISSTEEHTESRTDRKKHRIVAHRWTYRRRAAKKAAPRKK
jgi:hypothetical protein